MNNYPSWWNTTITVYNKFTDPQTQVVTWYSTVLRNCFWKYTGEKVKINNVTIDTNNTLCRVPKNDKFLPHHEWVNKPNDEMQEYFTFALGDIIICGEVNDIVDEYTKGFRSTDLYAKYKELTGCIRIEEVAINVGGGRCNEHYLIKGV